MGSFGMFEVLVRDTRLLAVRLLAALKAQEDVNFLHDRFRTDSDVRNFRRYR